MRSDPIIIVTCDRCRTEEELPLTATSHGYDERNTSTLLQNRGWTTTEGDLCENCSLGDGEDEEPSLCKF